MALAINQQILKLIRNEYVRRSSLQPLPQQKRLEKNLLLRRSLKELFQNIAPIYSSIRGNSSLFALLMLSDMTLQIISASGILAEERYVEFPADDPKILMSRALIERVSIHVPDISLVKRESIAERVIESGGTRVFDDSRVKIELVKDKENNSHEAFSNQIVSMLLLEFSKTSGAVLLTPLGLERSTDFGFGFIYEYREAGPFPPHLIQEARTYSAFFMQQIAERFIAGQN